MFAPFQGFLLLLLVGNVLSSNDTGKFYKPLFDVA